MIKRTFLEREITEYPTGDTAVEDVFYNEDGELAVSTYNIPKDKVGYSHSTVTESGEYVGGHGPDGRTWKERDDR